MSRKGIQEEYEPDPDMLCQYSRIVEKAGTESEIVSCERLAEYRVLLYLGQIVNGDASKPEGWKRELQIEYYCREHFDSKYRYAPAPTPQMTFTKIKRKTN